MHRLVDLARFQQPRLQRLFGCCELPFYPSALRALQFFCLRERFLGIGALGVDLSQM